MEEAEAIALIIELTKPGLCAETDPDSVQKKIDACSWLMDMSIVDDAPAFLRSHHIVPVAINIFTHSDCGRLLELAAGLLANLANEPSLVQEISEHATFLTDKLLELSDPIVLSEIFRIASTCLAGPRTEPSPALTAWYTALAKPQVCERLIIFLSQTLNTTLLARVSSICLLLLQPPPTDAAPDLAAFSSALPNAITAALESTNDTEDPPPELLCLLQAVSGLVDVPWDSAVVSLLCSRAVGQYTTDLPVTRQFAALCLFNLILSQFAHFVTLVTDTLLGSVQSLGASGLVMSFGEALSGEHDPTLPIDQRDLLEAVVHLLEVLLTQPPTQSCSEIAGGVVSKVNEFHDENGSEVVSANMDLLAPLLNRAIGLAPAKTKMSDSLKQMVETIPSPEAPR
eukprot:c17778_g1_i2.p1 GENE.c17778_g1_i2~~c17778_g1_i2.p1  ORF type:complete len:399 (+),score=77.52 c17778_g1_i2:38-1234(+)